METELVPGDIVKLLPGRYAGYVPFPIDFSERDDNVLFEVKDIGFVIWTLKEYAFLGFSKSGIAFNYGWIRMNFLVKEGHGKDS